MCLILSLKIIFSQLPQDILKYLDLKKWDVYYLGYPNISPEEKIKEIRRYIKGGWTNRRSDEELLDIFDKLINLSRDIEKTFKKKNIKFIDNSDGDVLNIYKSIENGDN